MDTTLQAYTDNLIAADETVKCRRVSTPAGEARILYIPQLTDRQMLMDFVIRPLMNYAASGGADFTLGHLVTAVLQCDEMKAKTDPDELLVEVYAGMPVLVLPAGAEYIVINAKKVEKKGIEGPQVMYTLHGPKDSFIENLDTNLSLIRYRMKDPRMQYERLTVGQRTRTAVVVAYLSDVANDKQVAAVKERINAIDIDGILDSGELQAFISENRFGIFPEMGIVERSDMACGALLEGKIVILVDGSCIALVTPKTFMEYLSASDDQYDNKFFVIYSKLLRYLSIGAAVFAVPLYIGLVSFNKEFLAVKYLITLALLRSSVPFNAFTEAVAVVFITEVLRECMLRVPKQIGPAIGMAGAIIIGSAAVSAGVFSPLILIIAALSLLTSFISPDYTFTNATRLLEAFMMVMTGMFGFLGFTAGLFIILAKTVSTTSCGVPFMAPYAPFNFIDFCKTFFYSKSDTVMRPRFLRVKNRRRGRTSGQ